MFGSVGIHVLNRASRFFEHIIHDLLVVASGTPQAPTTLGLKQDHQASRRDITRIKFTGVMKVMGKPI